MLVLNLERVEQERLVGIVAEETQAAARKPSAAAKPSPKKPRKPARAAASTTGGLFEREREHFYILMLLRAWNKPVTRHALDAGLVLMLNDEIRAGLLGVSKDHKPPKSPRIVDGVDYVLQEMQTLGHVEIDNTGPQQVLTVLPKSPPTDSAPEEDLTRISEVKQYFDRERARGNVTESEEHIDAKPDLVST